MLIYIMLKAIKQVILHNESFKNMYTMHFTNYTVQCLPYFLTLLTVHKKKLISMSLQ